jgi:hypothetical protein
LCKIEEYPCDFLDELLLLSCFIKGWGSVEWFCRLDFLTIKFFDVLMWLILGYNR